ncbi:MAG: adenosine deaminase [Nitriliruptoraceae bacterium]
MDLDQDLLRRAPKVLLHDHLDGGLRPATVIELAARAGHRLPTDDPTELAAWFHQGGRDADLERYLEAFAHTVAVLQTEEAIARVARECAEDLDADGVVYAEVRYAPELSTTGGLTLDAIFDALGAGFAAAPATIQMRLLACVMRQEDRGEEVVAAALRARERHVPVVGIDLAGPESGFPASRHAEAIAAARAGGLHVTLHAGEAAGVDSVADAVAQGAERLGHGVRVVDDLAPDGSPGPVARQVLAREIALEVCPTSNVHTGVVGALAEHPVQRLRDAGLRVTISTDNRLMSGVSTAQELWATASAFGWDLEDVRAVTDAAARAAFLDDEVARADLLAVIERGFAALQP